MTKKTTYPETSREAFASLRKEELNQTYKDIIRALGALNEATYEEIATFLMQPSSKIWKRMSELLKMEVVYRPGNKRPLKSNRLGFTWKLTNPGETPQPVTLNKKIEGKSVGEYAQAILKQQDLFSNQ